MTFCADKKLPGARGRVAPERTGALLLEELMVENHAIMMYSPLLEGSGE